ncbi:hypothetical protein CEXT_321771 [Caerostris extrusa]|uniref:Uncharacterized protein n=1 Tax=Caerostris extrusa TaxID=172846 RepID=A0AAV4V4E2_CAEEX|nr:hypothetical protein CEXT_321771 [Caerostris extrusa]
MSTPKHSSRSYSSHSSCENLGIEQKTHTKWTKSKNFQNRPSTAFLNGTMLYMNGFNECHAKRKKFVKWHLVMKNQCNVQASLHVIYTKQ